MELYMKKSSHTDVNMLAKFNIGDCDQYALIRGSDINNPLMVILHGGPGMSDMNFADKYDKNMEEKFLVVHWDRRGTGKSFNTKIKNSDLSFDLLINDIKEFIEFLLKIFEKKKVFLVGHSAGSMLGIKFAKLYGDLLHAYIGIGQFIDFLENEKIKYKFVIENAKKHHNAKALSEIEQIKFPKDEFFRNFENYKLIWKWLEYYEGVYYKEKNMKKLRRDTSDSSVYSLIDYFKLVAGSKYTIGKLWSEITTFDIKNMDKRFEIPVYFIYGKSDLATSSSVGKTFLNEIKAPRKDLYLVEKAGHFPQYENHIEYEKVIFEKILCEKNS